MTAGNLLARRRRHHHDTMHSSPGHQQGVSQRGLPRKRTPRYPTPSPSQGDEATTFRAMGKRVETGCRDCQKCTNSGVANLGRNSGRATMAMFTMGMSEAAMKTRKQCRACGHQMSLHGRQKTAEVVRPTARPETFAQQAPPPPPSQGPPAGWYNDPHGASLQRWWDGSKWTEHTSALG